MEKGGSAYILANGFKRLYTGVTSDLMHRVTQHKTKTHPDSFTAKYNITRLVYYESFATITEAIARESAIKQLNRTKKIALIVALNPHGATERKLGQTSPPFDESKLRKPETF